MKCYLSNGIEYTSKSNNRLIDTDVNQDQDNDNVDKVSPHNDSGVGSLSLIK